MRSLSEDAAVLGGSEAAAIGTCIGLDVETIGLACSGSGVLLATSFVHSMRETKKCYTPYSVPLG